MGLLNLLKKNSGKKNETFPSSQSKNLAVPSEEAGLMGTADILLEQAKVDFSQVNAIRLPIEQIATLGAGVSSLLPALRTITSEAVFSDHGLYRCVFPHGVNGQLATAYDGLNIGTIINDTGIAAQARWIKAGPQTALTTTLAPVNPAMIAMAAALAGIEKKLDSIEETQKQILSFLEQDKQSSIEGDLRTLTTIVKEYKFNWDNTTYTSSHHQLAADIKRTAEGNLALYQKQIADVLGKNQMLVMQQFVQSQQDDLQKKFKYYRMSLYIYSFASFLEVMLQKRCNHGYIHQVKQEILDRNNTYQEAFNVCYDRLSHLTSSTVEHHVLKGFGAAEKAIGGFIGSIPLVKDGPVDEWLIEQGNNMEKLSDNHGQNTLKEFESIRSPGSELFIDQLEQIKCLLCNDHEIYIDKDAVYLIN